VNKIITPVPPLDLTGQYATIESDISTAVLKVLASGQYINGPVVESFATAFGHYIGTEECVVCNSGTDALYLALRSLNIGPGDEVITSPFTFIATAEAISAVGAKPVFIDIERTTLNLNPTLIRPPLPNEPRQLCRFIFLVSQSIWMRSWRSHSSILYGSLKTALRQPGQNGEAKR